MKKIRFGALLLLAASLGLQAAPTMPTLDGAPLKATDGIHVNAHGGNIIEVDGTYYWYGEHRANKNLGETYQKGVNCYSSTDLVTWKPEGIVLATSDREGDPLQIGGIIERPKVVYNPKTGKYVMWFHQELKGRGYGAAYAGVATSDSPTGPFELVRTGRVNPGKLPIGYKEKSKPNKNWKKDQEWWTKKWFKAVEEGMFTYRDQPDGQMSRDMTIFVDDDSKAYHIYSSEENLTLQIAELDETWLNPTGIYIRIFPGGHNEAPTIFKKDGTYWMITSGCTGWAPNEARMMRADNIMGPWEKLSNPCRGTLSDLTFGGQGTYIFENNGKFYFMADVWKPRDLSDSRHLWLPIEFDADGVPYIDSPYLRVDEKGNPIVGDEVMHFRKKK